MTKSQPGISLGLWASTNTTTSDLQTRQNNPLYVIKLDDTIMKRGVWLKHENRWIYQLIRKTRNAANIVLAILISSRVKHGLWGWFAAPIFCTCTAPIFPTIWREETLSPSLALVVFGTAKLAMFKWLFLEKVACWYARIWPFTWRTSRKMAV